MRHVTTMRMGAGLLLVTIVVASGDDQTSARMPGSLGQRLAMGIGDFDLLWYTVDSGGADSAGGGFVLRGTIGQSDAGTLTGDGFVLTGGFWQPQQMMSCTGDLNGDGQVNAADLALLLGAWGPAPGSPADITADGQVNAADLALLLGAWGPCI